ncbi:hypothetical protein UP10_23830 [Bradyrhizobium sp. LTSPM299]|nr:hypothetical protein UP10_23830 [Bradyrhizobium sp. LTSPM299]
MQLLDGIGAGIFGTLFRLWSRTSRTVPSRVTRNRMGHATRFDVRQWCRTTPASTHQHRY